MANFAKSLELVIEAEGGYTLTDIPDDRGKQTYAGISRRAWPDWEGWELIDAGKPVANQIVADFYHKHFWEPMRCDSLIAQIVADAVFSTAVNVGIKQAIKLAQRAASVKDDGVLGPVTLYALNASEPSLFLARFALAKIGFYRDICTKDRSQMKFILGWINRSLKEAKC